MWNSGFMSTKRAHRYRLPGSGHKGARVRCSQVTLSLDLHFTAVYLRDTQYSEIHRGTLQIHRDTQRYTDTLCSLLPSCLYSVLARLLSPK